MSNIVEDPAIPVGSLILVTGANGFIGSHIANELLERGYNVRGTVRDTNKQVWLKQLFEDKYGSGRFDMVTLTDMVQEDAFDSVIKGVDGILHVASPTTWSADADVVIRTAVSGALNALKAANKELSVKRFVLTSSSISATFPKTGQPGIALGSDSWNEEAVALALKGSSNSGHHQSWAAYAASKTLAEQAVWKFSCTDVCRPDLVINTVLPCTNFGKSLDPVHQGHPSTSSFVQSLWNGTDSDRLAHISPQYFIDVQDTAKLHLAALILPDVEKERIYAWAEPWNFSQLLLILQSQHPDKDFIAGSFQTGRDSSVVVKPRERALDLLRRLGKNDFTTLEESVRLNVTDLY